MKTRKIHCHVYRDENEIKLRFIEMHEHDTSRLGVIAKKINYLNVESVVNSAFEEQPPEYAGHIDPMLMHLFGLNDIPELREYIHDTIGDRTAEEYKPIVTKQLNDLIYQRTTLYDGLIGNYARFNRQHWQTVAEYNLLSEDLIQRQYSVIRKKTHPFNTYWIRNHVFTLPTNGSALLKLIGCLDGAMHQDDIHAPRHGYQVKRYFFDKKPVTEKHEELLHSAFTLDVDAEAKQELSICVAKYIIEQYRNDPESLTAFKEAVTELEELLETEEASLTRLIRNKLYPDPTVDKFLETHCKNTPLFADMLNPKVSHVQAAQKVITSLREQLSKKPEKLTQEELATNTIHEEAIVLPKAGPEAIETEEEGADFRVIDELGNLVLASKLVDAQDAAANREFSHPIHENIATQFKTFEGLRQQLWNQYVDTLFGHPADDGGFYSSNYTEVTLMKECTMHLSPAGLMELDILKRKGSAYDRHYAPGELNHDILERELRMAFDLLGLHFLPEVDFHHGPILFDAESTKELMNRGMHYSEEYCKKLMQASHRHRLFSPNNKGEPNALIQANMLPKDIKRLIATWVEPKIHPAEDNAMSSMKLA